MTVLPFIIISDANTARHSSPWYMWGVHMRRESWYVTFGRKGAVISFPSCPTLCHGRQTVSFSVTRLATMAAESGVFGRVRVMSCAVTWRCTTASGNTRIDVVLRNKRRTTRSMRSVFWFLNPATYIFIYEHPMYMLFLSNINSQTCSFQ